MHQEVEGDVIKLHGYVGVEIYRTHTQMRQEWSGVQLRRTILVCWLPPTLVTRNSVACWRRRQLRLLKQQTNACLVVGGSKAYEKLLLLPTTATICMFSC